MDASVPVSFAGFRNRHKGGSVLVCGCGESLKVLTGSPPGVVTIGVNDVGRWFEPDYLVVLNNRSQFSGDRFLAVENSRAHYVFSQYNLPLRYSKLIRFALGRFAGIDISDPFSLPYTRNSPYVAVCLAAFMGAKNIGLLGVDFTEQHFFGRTGKHPLATGLEQIDQEYRALAKALKDRRINFVNLSPVSHLQSLPTGDCESFLAESRRHQTAGKYGLGEQHRTQQANVRKSTMRVHIETRRGALIGGFLDQMAKTVEKLGYSAVRYNGYGSMAGSGLHIVWNGRRFKNRNDVIYCEHGWLPREAYQVSPKGINANSHIAPYRWSGEPLADAQSQAVAQYLESLRQQQTFSQSYLATTAPAVAGLPEAFLLVPLQMEGDTNLVEHAPKSLRRMQALIDHVSQANPPWPIIFKQHPADARRGNRQLRLHVRRKCDDLRRHDEGNIHQILKSGHCKGIVSINSNVVHDGFLWDVPAVVMANNIWPVKGVSPFIRGLPEFWSQLEHFFYEPHIRGCREAYIHSLMQHQWTFDDARDEERVAQLIEQKRRQLQNASKVVSMPKRTSAAKGTHSFRRKTVNVVAQNRGWLFEDLKQHFSRRSGAQLNVITSEKPLNNADAWLYLRANEVAGSPDKARTLVQIHDHFDDGLYEPGGAREAIRDCGGLSLTHPDQREILRTRGIDFSGKQVLLRPIGASGLFRVRQSLPERFTIGWVGRPVVYLGEEFKRLGWLVAALERLTIKEHVRVALIGDRLDDTKRDIEAAGIPCHYYSRKTFDYTSYPRLYQELDCLVITAQTAAGPNCLFEALAGGVPVVATPCGWVETLVKPGANGEIAHSPEHIAGCLQAMYKDREQWFVRRHTIARSMNKWSLEGWITENLDAALALAGSHREEIKQGRAPA